MVLIIVYIIIIIYTNQNSKISYHYDYKRRGINWYKKIKNWIFFFFLNKFHFIVKISLIVLKYLRILIWFLFNTWSKNIWMNIEYLMKWNYLCEMWFFLICEFLIKFKQNWQDDKSLLVVVVVCSSISKLIFLEFAIVFVEKNLLFYRNSWFYFSIFHKNKKISKMHCRRKNYLIFN